MWEVDPSERKWTDIGMPVFFKLGETAQSKVYQRESWTLLWPWSRKGDSSYKKICYLDLQENRLELKQIFYEPPATIKKKLEN